MMKKDNKEFQNEQILKNEFNRLVLENNKKIYFLFRRMVATHEEADDLTQDTFIKAYKNYHRFEGKSSFYTWIYRIAVNTGINYIRKNKLRKLIGLESVYDLGVSDESINSRGNRDVLRKAIAELPAKQQMVVTLRSFQEMAFKEVAAVLEISVNSAKVNFSHALNNLKNILEKMGVKYESL